MITYAVMSRCAGNEPHRLIAASIGCAVPADPHAYGYLSEHHAFGENEKVAGDVAEDLFRRGVCLPSSSSLTVAPVMAVVPLVTLPRIPVRVCAETELANDMLKTIAMQTTQLLELLMHKNINSHHMNGRQDWKKTNVCKVRDDLIRIQLEFAENSLILGSRCPVSAIYGVGSWIVTTVPR